eukprot:6183507-Pleurochrysis_carterae.AAC.2
MPLIVLFGGVAELLPRLGRRHSGKASVYSGTAAPQQGARIKVANEGPLSPLPLCTDVGGVARRKHVLTSIMKVKLTSWHHRYAIARAADGLRRKRPEKAASKQDCRQVSWNPSLILVDGSSESLPYNCRSRLSVVRYGCRDRIFRTTHASQAGAKSRRGRGGWAPLRGRLRVRGASEPRRPCASGDEKSRERSASAPPVHMPCESKTTKCACERGPWRAATVSGTVARDDRMHHFNLLCYSVLGYVLADLRLQRLCARAAQASVRMLSNGGVSDGQAAKLRAYGRKQAAKRARLKPLTHQSCGADSRDSAAEPLLTSLASQALAIVTSQNQREGKKRAGLHSNAMKKLPLVV